MELVLYCPVCGYYEKEKDTVGRRGDFFTSVSVGTVFGELLAFQFAEWLGEPRRARGDGCAVPGPGGQARGKKGEGRIVEAGAHDGKLAGDILSWFCERRPELYHKLEYVIVEPSSRRQEWQKQMLHECGDKVRWVAALEELAGEGVCGIIFCNELLDAMPFHRLGWDAVRRKWFEWGVAIAQGEFVWVKMELAEAGGQKLEVGRRRSVSEDLLAILPDGFTTEICPAAENWWREAAEVLRVGKLLAIDYGLTAEEFFAPERKEGTLRAYSRHHPSRDVLADPGEQDITAHVNFTAIQAAGEAAGLRTEPFVTQEKFLAQIAEQISRRGSGFGEWTPARARQFQTLTHPDHLGRRFGVFVQSRG